MTQKFTSIDAFYRFYLGEHKKPMTRILHAIGSLGAITCVIATLITRQPVLLMLAPIVGYSFAWFSHGVIEKNRPATFTYPWYSFVCDFKMLFDVLRNGVNFDAK